MMEYYSNNIDPLAMVKEHLQVFGRVRPMGTEEQSCYVLSSTGIRVEVARAKLSNAKESQEYGFKEIFGVDSEQEEVFEGVARPVIDNCLEGYNGTIFAYGQTGSGKTYTMSGGDAWDHRGIIPRVISYIFQQFKQGTAYRYQLSVSFIEIYNECAYDLLAGDTRSKIVFLEDEDANLQMKNLQYHEIGSEDEGIKYLMEGNILRKVNCTSLNQTSSRSHSIFTLSLRGTHRGTQAEIYSKVHLVDLAGSQRVSRSQAEGVVLNEAKSINLSLTYLEQVIVSLNQKKKTKHVPYRNSLLTTLLRDSLGGNCKTVMIATFTLEKANIEETLSTLRFAQRVRLIQNELTKNENNPASTLIHRLEKENFALKSRLAQYESKRTTHENEEEASAKIEAFLNEKNNCLEIETVEQAHKYIFKIRELYGRRMREYVNELTFISEKLIKYDEILTKKEHKKNCGV